MGFRQFMFVIVVFHCHSEGFCRLLVCVLLQITETDEFAVTLVGHQLQDGEDILTVKIVGCWLYRASLRDEYITIIPFFVAIAEVQRLVDGHTALGLELTVAVEEACGLQPAGQGTLALEVLHLAFSCLTAGSEDEAVDFVDELLAVFTVRVVVVVDRLEKRIALLVEILVRHRFVPVQDGLGYLQVFKKKFFLLPFLLMVINVFNKCAGDVCGFPGLQVLVSCGHIIGGHPCM